MQYCIFRDLHVVTLFIILQFNGSVPPDAVNSMQHCSTANNIIFMSREPHLRSNALWEPEVGSGLVFCASVS